MADKILIVDDDPDMLTVLRWALSPVGDILEACEGRGALRRLAAGDQIEPAVPRLKQPRTVEELRERASAVTQVFVETVVGPP